MLSLKEIGKQYGPKVQVLRGLNLEVKRGESVAITGASGCGKSTLLNIAGTLDRPDSGKAEADGTNLLTLSDKQTAQFRNRQIGFVFQLHHLLPQCSVLENVLVPTLLSGDDFKSRAEGLLERVGLSHRLNHKPGELSGGERQRVALVRALIHSPKLLLADEPTGALNREGADELMDLLLELNREEQLTLVMVTHSERLSARLDRVLSLENGGLTPVG